MPAPRARRIVLLALGCALFGLVADAAAGTRVVRDRSGGAIRKFGAHGRRVEAPPSASRAQAATGLLAAESGDRRESRTHAIPGTDLEVGSDGRIRRAGAAGTTSAETAPLAQGAGLAAAPAASAQLTIDAMTTRGFHASFQPAGWIELVGGADTYFLNDGSTWQSGAGSYRYGLATLDRVEVDGDAIRYVLRPPADGVLYEQTDYDSGDHSAQGTLGVAGPLVIETTRGSTTAVLRGQAELLSNEPTWYGEPRFNFYSAVVGSVVPFEVTYHLDQGSWSETTFDGSFYYGYTGRVDFANPVSVPEPVSLEIRGSAQVVASGSAQFFAVAHFDSGTSKNVTDVAEWSVEPAGRASVDGGLLAVGDQLGALVLRASYEQDGERVDAEKAVEVVSTASGGAADWETYQGDAQHTGYVPVSLDPTTFGLRWQRRVGSGRPLNPVTAADGKVFVSLQTYFQDEPTLFALDARDGETLWSKGFGSVFSVNPPAYAYGNVYVQTGNHGSDTWLRAYEADTGAAVFQSPHEAQWERYYAPTIADGTVYLDGGTYGGMYAFDAFSGEQRWFQGLPQYDEWTPALDATRAYAYVGEYQPGLYALDRASGQQQFVIPDPDFDWNGWSMRLAPVVGEAGEVLAIHGGRLLSFDVAGRRIGWQRVAQFSGQPSVARGAIYAIDGGALAVLDEATGNPRWRWTPPAGEQLEGTLVVTDTHVLASSATRVHAIELVSHESVWSYPAAGRLALANDTLYVAAADGTLTALSLPEFSPTPPTALAISGPTRVAEQSSAEYRAIVTYGDGRTRDRSASATWSVEPAGAAAIDEDGALRVGELLTPSQTISVRASYGELGATVEGEIEVELAIGVGLGAFVDRNLAAALALEQEALALLDEARARERAAEAVLPGGAGRAGDDTGKSTSKGLLQRLRRAIFWTEFGAGGIERAIEELRGALGAGPTPAGGTAAEPPPP